MSMVVDLDKMARGDFGFVCYTMGYSAQTKPRNLKVMAWPLR
jgi:hypothetical protein